MLPPRALLAIGKPPVPESEDPLEEQPGEDPAARSDADRYFRAADLTARWLLPLAAGRLDAPINLLLGEPAMVHKLRARGLIEKGDVGAAMKEADLALAAVPADTQLPVELVPALDRHGHKAEADALFAKVMSVAEASAARHPHSALLHNSVAWMCAKCDRDLDKGLNHAEQATKLAPDAVGYLDTLAEVHFHRGERQAAIDSMKHCLELDPHFEYLQRQMKRLHHHRKPYNTPQTALISCASQPR